MIIFNERFKLQALIDFGGRYIYHGSHENIEYNRICSDQMDDTMKKFLIKMGMIIFSMASTAIGPLYAIIFRGILTTVSEARFPFTEPKSNEEFYANILLQSISSTHAMIAYFGLETSLTLLENVVTVTPRLINCDFEQMIESFEEKSIAEVELRLRIANIVKQSNDLDE